MENILNVNILKLQSRSESAHFSLLLQYIENFINVTLQKLYFPVEFIKNKTKQNKTKTVSVTEFLLFKNMQIYVFIVQNIKWCKRCCKQKAT